MSSQTSREGYVLIDNRESPGFTPEEAFAAGRGKIAKHVGAGAFFEGATETCGHWPCGRMVIKNPDRVRARGYCPKCDHFVCDQCEAERVRTGVCKPFKQGLDELREQLAKGATPWRAE
jgi:hypothetical protein